MLRRLFFPSRILIAALLCFVAFAPRAGEASGRDVMVFAAASLKTALEDVAEHWSAETGHDVTLSFAGSSALARQIQAGAPADVFISANAAWMDDLEARGLIDTGSRIDLASNALILIAPGETAKRVRLEHPNDLADRLGDGHLAMALVNAVPAGIYGKAALEHLGLWAALHTRVAQTDNVRAALALVARGEAPFGIVYATDAIADRTVTEVARFPQGSHPTITYPAAKVTQSNHPQADAFLAHLEGPAAQRRLAAHGFRPAQTGDTTTGQTQ